MYYNLRVNQEELISIITGLDTLTMEQGDNVKEVKGKAKALLAWIEADIAARQARGHYKNILQYGIDGLPFD